MQQLVSKTAIELSQHKREFLYQERMNSTLFNLAYKAQRKCNFYEKCFNTLG